LDNIISILYNVSMFILVFAGFITVLLLLGDFECTKIPDASFYQLPAMLKLLIITY